jgi:hypothetical protein
MTRRTRPSRSTFLAACVVLALVIASISCAPVAASRLTAEWRIRDTGISMSVPGPETPAISSDRAFDQCRIGAGACGPGDPTAIQLALATDTGSGQLDGQGKLRLLLDKTLVWAISWLGIPCPPHSGGPAAVRSEPVEPPIATPQPLCDEIAFVDAQSGTFYFTYTGPHQSRGA